MGGRDLADIDAWLATAAELGLVATHEAQTVLRLRTTLVEDQALLRRLEELSDDVEALAAEVKRCTSRMDGWGGVGGGVYRSTPGCWRGGGIWERAIPSETCASLYPQQQKKK